MGKVFWEYFTDGSDWGIWEGGSGGHVQAQPCMRRDFCMRYGFIIKKSHVGEMRRYDLS